jgi:uridine phosphorylase
MSFPNFAGKHTHDALFTPQDFVAYLRREQRLPTDLQMPAGIILSYQPNLVLPLLQQGDTSQVRQVAIGRSQLTLLSTLDTASGTEQTVGVCAGFGFGAPAVVNLLELCIALGARRFVSIGTAGGLQPALGIGDLVVCDRAIRDEGVSHHYLAPEPYAYPSVAWTERLIERLREQGSSPVLGASWTIDAPYRETVAEARHYQQAGVLTVEMEAAALFAVARLREVEMASAFVISDSLAELVWDPQFHSPAIGAGYAQLFSAARSLLLEI